MKTTRNKTIGLCVAAVVLLGHLSFAERLWPLQVGQTYMYTRSDQLWESWPVQMKVDKYIIHNSQTYFSYGFYNFENDGRVEDQGYARSTEDFVYYSPGDDHIAFQKASVGTKWTIYDARYNEYIVTEIVAIEPVTVPYGHFEEAYKHRNYTCDDPYDPGSWKSPYWYEWIVPGVGYVKQVDHWVDSMTPWIMELDDIIQNTEPVSITKFTAKAGKSAGTDSVQFSGVLGAVGLEVLVADEIVISLDADAMAAPLEWTFPINASTLKNGNFNAKTADSSFRYSIKNGKMTFSAKNVNLAGLACPLKVTITIGDSSESIELDTAIVNGPKKPCPPQFLMGARNSMTVDRAQVKFGKKPNTDSLTVRGFFTLADDGYDKNNPMIVWLGGQTFTVSGDRFKPGKFSESCTNAVSDEGPLVKAKFDFAKCTFQIQVRNAFFEKSGEVEFGLNCFGNNLPSQNITIAPLPAGRPVEITWVIINDPGFVGQMSRYETTNAQFARYLNDALASGDITVSGDYIKGENGSNAGQDFINENYYYLNGPSWSGYGATNGGASRIHYTGGQFTVESGFEKHPVPYVSWYGAMAFASYYGWRLPTESEWQAVADDTDGRNYATGDALYDYEKFLANYRANGDNDLAPSDLPYHPWAEYGTSEVGYFGTFGYGMADMAGNLWEWTCSGDGITRELRGGSWVNIHDDCSVAIRAFFSLDLMNVHVGFRVCR